jgi:hypothetical protein
MRLPCAAGAAGRPGSPLGLLALRLRASAVRPSRWASGEGGGTWGRGAQCQDSKVRGTGRRMRQWHAGAAATTRHKLTHICCVHVQAGCVHVQANAAPARPSCDLVKRKWRHRRQCSPTPEQTVVKMILNVESLSF